MLLSSKPVWLVKSKQGCIIVPRRVKVFEQYLVMKNQSLWHRICRRVFNTNAKYVKWQKSAISHSRAITAAVISHCAVTVSTPISVAATVQTDSYSSVGTVIYKETHEKRLCFFSRIVFSPNRIGFSSLTDYTNWSSHAFYVYSLTGTHFDETAPKKQVRT